MNLAEAALPLIQNVALLLAAVLVFDLFPVRGRPRDTPLSRVALGTILGVLTIIIMLTPWRLSPGLVFDTRSVLVGISGLFFGSLPTAVCVAMASAYRLYQGGVGAWTGVSVILASGLIGVAWRYRRKRPLHEISWAELYRFGLTVHAAMLLLMLTLPWDTALAVLRRISLPVILLYPLGTALTGALLARRLRNARVREELEESETLFRKLFEDHAAVKMLLDPETGRIMDANRAAAEFYGWSREQLQSMRIQEINTLPPEKVREEMDKAASARRLRFEFRHRLADGTERDVEVLSGAVVHKGRQLIHSIVHDVSDRKRMQEALRASESYLKSVLDSSNDGILVEDADTGALLDVNRAMCEMYGYSREDILELSVADLSQGEPPYSQDDALERLRAARTEGPQTFTWLAKRSDGGLFWVEVSIRYAVIGGQDRFVVMVRDITSRKRAEDELRQAKEDAEAANRAKSEFLAIMSHEIRTPLSGVMGMLQLLREPGHDAERDEWLAAALEASRHLHQILSDVLDLSSVESGKMQPRRAPFLLKSVIAPVAGALAESARAKGLALSSEVDPALSRPFLGDAGRLRQIIFNLVGNALKYTERGEIHIEAYPLPLVPAGADAALHLVIRDTGIGIPDDKLKAVIEPFTQVENPYTRRQGGAGLGLSIVKRLVTAMNGSLTICSEPGVGTEVHVTLPLAYAAGDMAGEQAGQAPALPPLRLLLVEDERVNRLAVSRMLERAGHSVTAVGDGRSALAELKAGDVDAVLMDIQMPDMDGLAATRAIRSDASLGDSARVPVIALTAHAMPGDRERFLAAGMDGYISKPVESEELERELGRVLRGASPGFENAEKGS
ncbi:PAS domain S-box protein [Desulfovibrio aminophilus]|nr:PAS domain S-box protein [Desulfovibrio aminophilus]MCM0755635.1 PAS domain S-box protein [Desulfovibrio aminophilus]